jgi:hypothetical protein
MQYFGMVSPKLRVCIDKHQKQALYGQHRPELCICEILNRHKDVNFSK